MERDADRSDEKWTSRVAALQAASDIAAKQQAEDAHKQADHALLSQQMGNTLGLDAVEQKLKVVRDQ